MSLLFRSEGYPSVLLLDEAIATLKQYSQTSDTDTEGGGQLFAKFSGEHTAIVVATPPRATDRRWRYRFIPNRISDRLEINHFHKTGLHYVGDWHTHPQSKPIPSNEDIKSMRDCYIKSKHALHSFVLIVVGTAEYPEGIYLALVNNVGLTELAPSEFQET